MNYSQTLTDLLTIKYNGCIIYKEENGLYRQGNFTGTLQEVKEFIDKPISLGYEISKGVFVGENHSLHPNNIK